MSYVSWYQPHRDEVTTNTPNQILFSGEPRESNAFKLLLLTFKLTPQLRKPTLCTHAELSRHPCPQRRPRSLERSLEPARRAWHGLHQLLFIKVKAHFLRTAHSQGKVCLGPELLSGNNTRSPIQGSALSSLPSRLREPLRAIAGRCCPIGPLPRLEHSRSPAQQHAARGRAEPRQPVPGPSALEARGARPLPPTHKGRRKAWLLTGAGLHVQAFPLQLSSALPSQ